MVVVLSADTVPKSNTLGPMDSLVMSFGMRTRVHSFASCAVGIR